MVSVLNGMTVKVNNKLSLCQSAGSVLAVAEGKVVADFIGIARPEALVFPVNVLKILGGFNRNSFSVGFS